MKSSQLTSKEYGPYYQGYIDLAGNDLLIAGLTKSMYRHLNLFSSISEDKMNSAYAEGKWTIKELIVHLIDAERVFAYRALRCARKDKTDLPGFDQDDYVATSEANNRSKASLIEEYEAVRKSTISLFKSFTDDMLEQVGTANGNPMSPRALGFIIIGHEKHHARIIRERYL